MEEGGLLHKMKKMLTSDEEQERVTEEIMSMVDEGHDKGVFAGSEAEMIRNIFEYGDKDAKDIMTHRKHILAINREDSLDDVLSFILEQNNSRFPVYEEDIDNIVGTLHLRDVINCYFKESIHDKPIGDLKEYIRPVSFVPETKSIDSLFRQMQAEKNHMAIVIDEYGQTSGIVTMEDIIEEIVGNILDEYDEEEELITCSRPGIWIANGMLELDDLEDILSIPFDEEDCETLNGFLVFMLEHIPAEGETCVVLYQGYRFTVLEVHNNMIERVRIEKLSEEEYALQKAKEELEENGEAEEKEKEEESF